MTVETLTRLSVLLLTHPTVTIVNGTTSTQEAIVDGEKSIIFACNEVKIFSRYRSLEKKLSFNIILVTPVPKVKRWEETIKGITYEVVVIEETKPETLTWYGSKKLCEDHGSQLPVPTNDEMNTFLVNAVPAGVYAEIHLGIKRTYGQPTEHHYGNYHFYDANKRDTSKPITYSNWHRAEPNGDKTRETAAGMIANHNWGHGKWYNFYTSSYRGVQYKGRPVFHICMTQGKYNFSLKFKLSFNVQLI